MGVRAGLASAPPTQSPEAGAELGGTLSPWIHVAITVIVAVVAWLAIRTALRDGPCSQ